MRAPKFIAFLAAALIGISSASQDAHPQKPSTTAFAIPKAWDNEAMATLEVPLANPVGSPQHVSADYYYKIPVRPIYKQYPIYAPGHEPPGYMDRLKQQEPVIVWEDAGHSPPLRTEADWIKAGEIAFDAPISYGDVFTLSDVRSAEWYEKSGMPVSKDGFLPFLHYVIRKKGEVEVGMCSCAMCHTRVMPNGTTLKGAQGNMPFDRALAYSIRARFSLEDIRAIERSLFSVPWLSPDPEEPVGQMSVAQIASLHEAIPPSVLSRNRSSPFYSPQIPDLIGVKERKYLDRTGLQQQRSLVDLMRYAALNQGADSIASFDGFLPADFTDFKKLPDPADRRVGGRYSDEQLYALALYVYSLQPPPNPNKFDALAARGEKVFQNEGCARCHTPPLYTNNKLTPAEGFTIPEDHLRKYDILPIRVGTDSNLTLKTRRGTGYYKVPSLKGVWYRGMFGHSGWCATLEDWFDPRRTHDDYVPTGFKPYGAKTYAVKGHPFGLSLSDDDRKALIAFLKTL
jgi:hypothetical protein